MNWKETYTKVILNQMGETYNDISVRQYMPLWWQNTREKTVGGLRLTDAGMQKFLELDIEVHEVPFPDDFELTTQILIFLDKFIDCPYYISKRSIYVTDNRKAVELSLFSGDLRKYGLTKALKNSENIPKNS